MTTEEEEEEDGGQCVVAAFWFCCYSPGGHPLPAEFQFQLTTEKQSASRGQGSEAPSNVAIERVHV